MASLIIEEGDISISSASYMTPSDDLITFSGIEILLDILTSNHSGLLVLPIVY